MDKILVVDDEMINLMMVKKILGEEYEVITASSGEAALEELETILPSLILLDIHMEGIDGYEVLQNIRQKDELAEIPVIFLTADDNSAAEVKGFELGAEDFIKKPFVSAVVKHRVNRSIEGYRLRTKLQNEVEKQTEKAEKRRKKLQILSVEIIEVLASAIDAKDIYTKGHSVRVAEYSVVMARKLGWPEEKIEKLRYKALLHDIGKIGVPDRVLNKDGRLTDDEFEVIKSHTIIGSNLLQGVSSFSDMHIVARNHHERYDGKGYPDNLKGKQIPIEARVVGIADAYDAMSSDRVYRKALPREVIREELIKGRGTQFDPNLLDCFLELFDNDELSKKGDFEGETAKIDLEKMIQNIIDENDYQGALVLQLEEMAKIYNYVENVHSRYGLDYSTVLITLTFDEDLAREELSKGMKAMEFSIVQSLRKVDIINRISSSQFLIVLTEAHEENIKMIIDRIFAGFYRNYQGAKIRPVYEIK